MNKLKTLKKQLMLIKENGYSIVYLQYLIYVLSAGIFPVLGMIIPRFIINHIELGTIEINIVYQFLIKIGILLILSSIGMFYVLELSRGAFVSLRTNEFKNMCSFLFKVDYQYLENKKWLDDYNRSCETLNSDNSGFQPTYSHFFEVSGLIASSIIYIYLISKASLWITLVIFITFGFSFYFNHQKQLIEFNRREDQTSIERQIKYYRITLEDVKCAKDIRIFGLFENMVNHYHQRIDDYVKLIRYIKNKQFNYSCLEIIDALFQDVISYSILIYLAYHHKILLGDFTLYIMAIVALNTSLNTISIKIGEMDQWLGLTQEYFDFNEKYLVNQSQKEILNVPDQAIEIEFKNVSFRYPNTDKYVIKNLNLKIAAGEKLAIVGINGAGKSTIVKLLTGLFKPTSGQIFVNGKDITNLNLSEYQKLFSVVFQDFNIYNFDVNQNVSMSAIDKVNHNKVKEAIEQVGLSNKINSLPKKYNTTLLKVIDETGVELSGGQKQNIAIARAIYHQGKCVILDEPTAALDALAEQRIYENFNELIGNKTAIFISHRLASTKFCDKIALFDNDGLKEYGTHEELYRNKKEYYKMFKVQGQYYQEAKL